MKLLKRLFVILLILFFCAGCDQGTKSLAKNYLPKNEMQSYFHDTLRLGYTENVGAILSIGSSWSKEMRFWSFIVFVGTLLFGLFIYFAFNTKLNFVSVVGYSLVLGGGISNLYDRIMQDGAVVDFINLGIRAIRTGVFNVADTTIMLGMAFVLVTRFKHKDNCNVF